MGKEVHKRVPETAPKYFQIFFSIPPGHALVFPCKGEDHKCVYWRAFYMFCYGRGIKMTQSHEDGEHRVVKEGSVFPYYVVPATTLELPPIGEKQA